MAGPNYVKSICVKWILVLLAILGLLISSEAVKRCEMHQVHVPSTNKCLWAYKPVMSNMWVDYEQAIEVCRNESGTLAEVDTEEEYRHLVKYIGEMTENYDQPMQSTESRRFWISQKNSSVELMERVQPYFSADYFAQMDLFMNLFGGDRLKSLKESAETMVDYQPEPELHTIDSNGRLSKSQNYSRKSVACQKYVEGPLPVYNWIKYKEYEFKGDSIDGNIWDAFTAVEDTFSRLDFTCDSSVREENTQTFNIKTLRLQMRYNNTLQNSLEKENSVSIGRCAQLRLRETLRLGGNFGNKIKIQVAGRFPIDRHVAPSIVLRWANQSYKKPNSSEADQTDIAVFSTSKIYEGDRIGRSGTLPSQSYKPIWKHPSGLGGNDFSGKLNYPTEGPIQLDYGNLPASTNVSGAFNIYGVELSNEPNDEYIRFYVINPDGSISHDYTQQLTDGRSASLIKECENRLERGASHCSYIAPLDDPFTLHISLGPRETYRADDKQWEAELYNIKIYRENQVSHFGTVEQA